MMATRYHSFLRISLLVATVVLLFDGGFFSPVTKELSDNTILYIGSVGAGMFASVPPNEVNTLTAQITERERELDAREGALREREIQARSYDTDTDYSVYILSGIVFILTVLIVLNFGMDWMRVRKYREFYEKSMG